MNLEDGRVGIGGILRDVTERKQAEESLRISEARYRELADTIPAGVYEATVDGYFTYANRTAMEMYGYGEDDIRQGIHFLQVIAPEDHDAAKRRSQAVREGKALPYMDYTFVRKDGSRFPGLLTSKPVKQNGQVVGLMGVVTDISALKEAQSALRKNEAMLQSILKAVPVGIAFGRERTLQWSNEYYQRMTGYGEDDVSGRTARLLYESEEEFQRVGKELYGSTGKDGIGETQTRWKRQDGSMIDVLLSVAPALFGRCGTGGRHLGPRCHREKEGRRGPSGKRSAIPRARRSPARRDLRGGLRRQGELRQQDGPGDVRL